MLRADYRDKNRVVQILAASFDDNKSVNFIVKQDGCRAVRLRKLMEYSFELCHRYGAVWLSEDRNACALVLFPHLKKSFYHSLRLDLSLAVSVIGLSNLGKVIRRESAIKKLHPREPFYYLWFIGVSPEFQNKGLGTEMLKQVLREAEKETLPVYLETSVPRNVAWYEKFGFSIYTKLDFGYELFCLQRTGE